MKPNISNERILAMFYYSTYVLLNYIVYGLIIQNFISVEIIDYFNISYNQFIPINIFIFLSILIGFLFSNYIDKILFIIIIFTSIFSNAFIKFINDNYYIFLIIRALFGFSYGIIIPKLLYFYKHFSIKVNVVWPVGLLIASLITYLFIPNLGWNSAFYFLLGGIFIFIIFLHFPKTKLIYKKSNYIRGISFDPILIIDSTVFFLLTFNIKYIVINKLHDIDFTNIYLIVFSLLILLSYLLANYIIKNFNENIIIPILYTLIILSSFDYLYLPLITASFLTIKWKVCVNNTPLNKIFFSTIIGGIFASFISYFDNIFLAITILPSIGFIIYLTKNYKRNYHLMK
jgi:MFS family permease